MARVTVVLAGAAAVALSVGFVTVKDDEPRPAAADPQFACGPDRLAGNSVPAYTLTTDPRPTTIAALRALAPPAATLETPRRPGLEQTRWQVQAQLVGVSRRPDGSLRLILAEPGDERATLVAILPGRECASGDLGRLRTTFAAVRRALVRACGPVGARPARLRGTATVTALGFVSPLDQGVGSAPTGVQLRPVLELQVDACKRPGDPVLLAAGDAVACVLRSDVRVAALVARIPGTIALLGDTSQDVGAAAEFEHCYSRSWGRFKSRTRPVPGDHDYLTPGAAGFFGYFGERAGPPGRGYYSYDLGTWHMVALNSNCDHVGGCERTSPQEEWLRADLAANPRLCTLAYWHHPRFSSGPAGDYARTGDLWRTLYEYGADVVLAGSHHAYERFAPLDPAGRRDDARGIRSFVAGTGGGGLHEGFSRPPHDASDARIGGTYGVVRLILRPGRYEWRFLPAERPDAPRFPVRPSDVPADDGRDTCH